MYKHKLLQLSLLAGLVMAITASCEKKDDDKGGSGSSGHRISEWTAFDDYTEDERGVVTYDGNKVKEVIGYMYQDKGEWVEGWKYGIEYPDENTIILIHYDKEGDTWEAYDKDIMYFDNNYFTGYTNYDLEEDIWVPDYKEDYTYEDGNIRQISYSSFHEDQWVEMFKDMYEFDGDKLVEILGYITMTGTSELASKSSYEYDESTLQRILDFDYMPGKDDWDSSNMIQLEYANNKVTKATYYDYEEPQWEYEGHIEFSYDANGNISSWEDIYTPTGDSWMLIFTYADGIGNFSQIFAFESFGPGYFWHPFPSKKKDGPLTIPELLQKHRR